MRWASSKDVSEVVLRGFGVCRECVVSRCGAFFSVDLLGFY